MYCVCANRSNRYKHIIHILTTYNYIYTIHAQLYITNAGVILDILWMNQGTWQLLPRGSRHNRHEFVGRGFRSHAQAGIVGLRKCQTQKVSWGHEDWLPVRHSIFLSQIPNQLPAAVAKSRCFSSLRDIAWRCHIKSYDVLVGVHTLDLHERPPHMDWPLQEFPKYLYKCVL